MTYAELLETGRKMKQEELEENIRQLANDPRFAAVVAWLERNRDGFAKAGAAQSIAGDHGKLAHCGGSTHAVLTLQGQLINVLDPKPKRRAQPAAEE